MYMQQLEVEHKKIEKLTTSNQIVGKEQKQKEELENKRESKGQLLATTRKIYRLLNSDVYYVQSERSDNIYYYVKYNPSVFEWCSCLDNSTRHVTCKHLHAIEFAIRMGTLQDIDKLPADAKRYNGGSSSTTVSTQEAKSYKDDDYSF
jgi:hypothetical protein